MFSFDNEENIIISSILLINSGFNLLLNSALIIALAFSSLSKENIYKIIDIEIKKVESKLKAMNLSLEITTAFKDLLIDKGYDEKMGARPLKRAIQHYLEDPLSDEILGGELEGNVVVDYDPSSNKILLNGKQFDVNESKIFKYLKPLNEFFRKLK